MLASSGCSLFNNQIGDQGATAIAKALEVNAVLTTLNLAGNQICGLDEYGEGTYTVDGIKALAKALVKAPLTTLDISINQIGDEGAQALAKALKVNAAVLTSLGLGNNTIRDQGAAAIAEALKVNAALTKLE